MNSQTSELRDLRARLEETATAHAQEVKKLQEQARDLGRQREYCMREVSRPPCALLGSTPYMLLGAWFSGDPEKCKAHSCTQG